MDVKEAVKSALEYVQVMFGSHGGIQIQYLALEEVEYDEQEGVWVVTVGFSRPWDQPRGMLGVQGTPPNRTYKVVRVAPDGTVISAKHRKL